MAHVGEETPRRPTRRPARPIAAAGRPATGRSTTPTPGTGKRLDLQGLRAVAVLLVALSHANVPFLTGGYVGVDVFFVLSGFFITGLLLRDGFGRDGGGLGSISIRRFYARRARRILPAAALTLLVTSIAVYVLYDLDRDDFLATRSVLEDGFAASLFYANIHFIATASNYFAQATTTMPSPFQHFWSLSVEEQFYIVWPSVLAVAFFACRRGIGLPRLRRRARRRARSEDGTERQRRTATRFIGLLIATGCAISLIWSIRSTATDPQAAYYSTPVRVWEFGCGAGLALLAARPRPLPKVPLALLGWLGLAMIAASALFYTTHTSFPGDAALLPVLGAGLIVLAGMIPTRAGVNRPLSIQPLPYIGDRSYAFYLWHYPVLILVWQAAGHVLPVGINLALLAGAFALSALTYAHYENPLRFARWLQGWRTAAMVPLAMSASVLAALIPIAAFQATVASEAVASHRVHASALAPARRQPDPRSLWAATPIPAVGAAAAAVRRDAPLPKAIVPSLQQLEQENTFIGYDIPKGCQPRFGPHAHGRVCLLGDPSSRHVVALVGDSHAGMWMPALEADARAQGFAIVPLDKPGCILPDVHRNLPGWPCANWYRWALAEDHRLHPVATIVSFQFTAGMEAAPGQTDAQLHAALAQVRHGVLLVDPPGQSQLPADCISRSGATMRECSSQLPGTYVPLMHAIGSMTAHRGYPTIPTLQWFCARGICPMVVDHILTMRDRSHFTMEYSAALAPLLGLELRPILSRLARAVHHSSARLSTMVALTGLSGARLGRCPLLWVGALRGDGALADLGGCLDGPVHSIWPSST